MKVLLHWENENQSALFQKMMRIFNKTQHPCSKYIFTNCVLLPAWPFKTFLNFPCHYLQSQRGTYWAQRARFWLAAKETMGIQCTNVSAWVRICTGNITSHYPDFDRHPRVVRTQGERREEGKRRQVRTGCETEEKRLQWETMRGKKRCADIRGNERDSIWERTKRRRKERRKESKKRNHMHMRT